MAQSPGRLTLLAFAGVVLLGGLNGTSIGVLNREVAPLWGAVLRFGLASLIFFALAALRRAPLPRGRALVGSVLYGVLGFGVAFALVSVSLVQAGPGTTQVILALVPLLTFLLAVAQRLERFRLQGLAGALLAVAGVAIVFVEKLGVQSVSLLALLGVLAGSVAIAEANVVLKRFPHADPLANNAVAMGVGALMLIGLSLIAGESWSAPQQPATIAALAYLVLIGSVVVFTLYLYVIDRWTASATSYSFLLMPIVAVVASALVLGEAITPLLIVGGAVVVVGVYLGAFAPSISRPLPGLSHRPAPEPAEGPPTLATPNCP